MFVPYRCLTYTDYATGHPVVQPGALMNRAQLLGCTTRQSENTQLYNRSDSYLVVKPGELTALG